MIPGIAPAEKQDAPTSLFKKLRDRYSGTAQQSPRQSPAGRAPAVTRPTGSSPGRPRPVTADPIVLSVGAAVSRDHVKQLIREKGVESSYICPKCKAPVKGKNLVRHMDEQHRW
jgi:hypothetical protein